MTNCSECHSETTAKNTMGDNGGVLCGPCKKQEQWRKRLETKRQSLLCCESLMELADDGIYECFACKKVIEL